MACLLLIFSQSDYLIQIVNINSNTEWQTVQIQISWLLQKPTDLDLHCLQKQGISGFSMTRVKCLGKAHLLSTYNICFHGKKRKKEQQLLVENRALFQVMYTLYTIILCVNSKDPNWSLCQLGIGLFKSNVKGAVMHFNSLNKRNVIITVPCH